MSRWFRTRAERELDAAVDIFCASLQLATVCVQFAGEVAIAETEQPRLAAPVVPSPPYLPEVM